jgi:hypothetical protein
MLYSLWELTKKAKIFIHKFREMFVQSIKMNRVNKLLFYQSEP